MGFIDHLNLILPDQVQSTEILMYLISIYSNLSNFVIKFDISQLFMKTKQSLLLTSQIDHDTFNISLILDILRERLFYFINDLDEEIKFQYINLFADTFLPIIIPFLISDNLEQRINMFKEIDKILNDSRFENNLQKSIALFLTSNDQQQQFDLSLLSNLKFHKEYKNAIASIFNCLSLYESKNLNLDLIQRLWINNQNLSSTDRFLFFQLFLSIADHDTEGSILTTIINCILNHNEFTEQNVFEWFDMIDVIIHNLESRHTSVKFQIDMVRQVLWSISFQLTTSPISSFTDFNSNIIERSRKSLTKIINVEPDEDDFSRIIAMLHEKNEPFLYTLLNEFLKDPQLPISEEEIQEMINQTMNQLTEEFSDPNSDPSLKSKIYNFFLCLCKFSNSSFNDEQIDKLCSLQDLIPDFFSLLLHLSYSNSINEFDLEKIIQKINPNSINKTFYKFIKKIIVEVNGILDSNIKFLPLKHENTLWHFATTNTEIRHHSSKFLCKLYSLNDGISLDDKTMIDTFYEHWLVYYLNNPNDDELLKLLKMFIETIELKSYRDFSIQIPHQYSENELFVKVETPEKIISLSVPYLAQVGMIEDKVSLENKIELNTFNLLLNEKRLKSSEFLNKYISNNSNELNLNFCRKNSNLNSNKNGHHRTQLPSISFINNPTMPINEIYEKIEDGNKNAFNLLQVLPTLSFTPNFENQEKIDLLFIDGINNAFNVSKPLVFFYNFESLLKSSQISHICQNYEFINFLYSNVDELFMAMKTSIESQDNNNELILLIIIFLKRISSFSSREMKTKIFYLLIKCAIEMKDLNNENSVSENSLSMVNQILQQTNVRNSRINFPQENFIDIFNLLIFNNNSKIRNISLSLFNHLNIPLMIFLKSIELFKNDLSVEFLLAFNDHFDDDDDRSILINENLMNSVLSLIDEDELHGTFLNALLLIILKLIKLEIIDEKNKLKLLIYLLKKFLILDFDENDRVAFYNASECISHLSYIRQNITQDQQEIFDIDYNNNVMNLLNNKENCCSNKLLLEEVLNLHHNDPFFVDTVFSHYMINGDECSISPYNQVGLKNIGMTCYMNSIFQQFFHLKPLRYALMNYKGDNQLLSEISHLFYLMKYAKTKFIDPTFVVKKWEMRPNMYLNPKIQQDAAEIIHFLLHSFEEGEELKNEVKNLFNGEFSHPIDGIDIEYHTETKEEFPIIQLEVENCNDIMESFNNLTKPELFLNDSQYYAEDLEARINAKRSTFIQKVPPILIVHLMRFYYNYSLNKRTKITNPFTVFKTIDISDVCINKGEKLTYVLIGVIVHKGTAASGHYVSFVYKKKKDIWLCFDDANVTEIDEIEVLNQASGKNPESTGYILFYEKKEFTIKKNNNFYNNKIPEDLKDEIDNINNETMKAKLMCSNGYFNLMQNLSFETSMSYFDICLKFTVDTLPFMKIETMNEKYFDVLKNKLKSTEIEYKEKFLEFLIGQQSQYINKALFYCPNKEVRKNFSSLLLCLFEKDTKLDVLSVASCVFELVDSFWSNYQQSDSFFKVLYELYKKFEVVKNYAIENNWPDKLCEIFGSQFSSFRKENPELTASYIFKGMDMTHYLKLIVLFDITKSSSTSIINEDENDEQKTENLDEDKSTRPILNGSFFLNICLSSSSTPSIARFAHKYFTVNDFLYFLQGKASKLKPFRIASLMYFIVPNRATFNLLNFPFKTQQGRDLTRPDIIAMMIGIVSIWNKRKPKSEHNTNDNNTKESENVDAHFVVDENDFDGSDLQGDFVKSIIDMAETWLPAFLYDDNSETRNLCLSLCAFLAPCNLFDPSLYNVKIESDLEIPELEKVDQKPVDEFIKSCFQRFLDICLGSISVLTEEVKDHNIRSQQYQGGYESSFGDELAEQFLSLITVLLQVVSPKKEDISSLSTLYITLTQSSTNPFNSQTQKVLMTIYTHKMKINVDDLLIPFIRDDLIEIISGQSEMIYFSLEQFLPLFLRAFNENDQNCEDDEILPFFDKFFDTFFRVVVFQSVPYLSKNIDEISDFLKKEVSLKKNVKKNLTVIIDDYFDSLILNNFWGLCIALNAIGEMRPGITDFLPDHMDELKKCGCDINKMTQIAITSSLSQTISKIKLDEMINTFHFNEETLKMLLSLSYM